MLAAAAMAMLAAIAVGCVTTRRIVSSAIPAFAYVSNQNDNNVTAYSVGIPSGALVAVAGSPFTGTTGPRNMALCHSGQLLYVANGDTNGVSGYKIDLATGALTPVPGSPFAGGNAPRGIAADPSGSFVYVANSGDNTVSGYAINGNTGALTPVPGSPFAADNGPFGITVDPTGRFVYAANHHSSDISAYSINAKTGALAAITGSPFADGGVDEVQTGPFEIAVTPSGSFLYVTNHFTNDVAGFNINTSSGALTPFSSGPYPAGNEPFGIQVAPSGDFVYVANRGSADIYVYSVDPGTGALLQIEGSPYSVGEIDDCSPSPYELALDGTGSFLYAPDNGCGVVSAFSVDAATGALTMMPGSPFAAGNGAYGVAISRLRVQ